MRLIPALSLLSHVAATVLGAASIEAVQNAASNIPAGLPNDGIAQGSMFIIKGSDLGPLEFVVADQFPLQTSIAGTSVEITVNGTSVDGIMYYAGSTQVAVILPSATPVGDGTVTVTYNNQTSPPFSIKVVRNAFGVFTVSQSGSGDAIAFRGMDLVTPANAANPGEVVSFWGTGLGPVNFDETNAAQQFDMTDVALEAFVGGRPSNVLFRGRNACCSAVDAAYVVMPPGVAGCATPVTFKIGNVVSNTTTIALAESGRNCTPTSPAVAAQGSVADWLASGSFASGSVGLQRSVSVTPSFTVSGVNVPGSTQRMDSANANFYNLAVPPGGAGLGGFFDIAAFGSCTVLSYSGPIPAVTVNSLDAGDPLSVAGPPGMFNLVRNVFPGGVSYSLQLDQTGTTIVPGTYRFTGPGGPGVGSFAVDLDVPPALVWSDQADIFEIDRSAGVTVNWTGGAPSGYVQISGYSFIQVGQGSVVSAFFDCTARTSDGQFTVGPVVLLALPVTTNQDIGGILYPNFGTLSVNSYSIRNFQATGIDYGTAIYSGVNDRSVVYK